MAVYNHTPLAVGDALNASVLNAPLAQLDAAIRKNNYAATAAPTTGDDLNDGYAIGSRWIDITNDRAYVAVDVTVGAAVWKEMSFPSSVAQNFGLTGILTVTGSEVINSASGGGFTLNYTGASSSGTGPGLTLNTNDGAAMASADRIGQFAFGGHNGTSVVNGAFMIVQTTELWSGTARGCKVLFYTTPNTTTALTLALTINHNADLDSAGNMNVASGKVYKVNGTQVVGPRDTGWTAMTGTPDESTAYATGSVTLPQLAGRVMALQAALTTHGLLGT